MFGAIQLSIEGEQARAAPSLGREVFSNFYPKSNEQTRAACKNIVNLLAKCIPEGKFRKRWKEKMWWMCSC